MKVSRERLFSESGATGFRAELLEKVFHLLGLLEGFRSHPFLGERFVLKGGTALNLFLLQLPRISMDIDLNYVGDWRAELMVAERGTIEGAVEAVCSREGLTVRRKPEEHASTNWSLRYESASASHSWSMWLDSVGIGERHLQICSSSTRTSSRGILFR
jgi:predicted nucleotidyltransferase component of viral defense system